MTNGPRLPHELKGWGWGLLTSLAEQRIDRAQILGIQPESRELSVNSMGMGND